MNGFRAFTIGAAIVLTSAASASADVQLAIKDGRVSLVAKDVTVRQILAEWARIGQTKIVNIEKMTGGQVTLELTNVTEAQALDVLLRSVAGYMAAPRASNAGTLSTFDRIVLMPTSAAPRTSAASAAPTFQQPQFSPAAPMDDEDGPRPASPNGPTPVRGPVFNAVPPPVNVNPQPGQQFVPGALPPQAQPPAAAPPSSRPGVPSAPYGGVAVPGMVVPAPPGSQPPAQPGIGTPTQRPGGRGGQ